jgi:glycerol-3-phosphate acyltransferase PlsY
LTRILLTVAFVSYLLGSIPFGYLLVRMFRGEDVRHTGSGNIGATNVARTGSKRLAIATLLLDAAKGFGAVAFAFWFTSRMWTHSGMGGGSVANARLQFVLAALAAFCAIVGHMYPVWLRFKGGKGVATAAGAFAALAPRAMLISLVLFVVVVAFTRYVSLGSMVAAAAFPLMAWWSNPTEGATSLTLLLMAASSLLIVWRHKDNIRRLLAGTENRFR